MPLGSNISGTATGAVVPFLCSTAPDGYVIANGGLLSRSAYPALWAHAQSCGNLAANDASWSAAMYSPGDGTTTFRIPELRGEFPRFADLGRGIDAGRSIGTLQLDQFQGHGHNIIGVTNYNSGGSYGPTGSGANNPLVDLTQSATTPESDGTNGNPRFGTETRPRNVALLPCIKT